MAEVTDISLDSPTNEYPKSALYNHLTTVVRNEGGINLRNIARIVISVMQFTQGFTSLRGPDKKNLVVYTISRFVDEEVTDEQLSRDLQMFIQMTLPGIIDTFVSLNNGETQIKVKNCLVKLFKKCACF
jgi:hypothetical protein